MEGVRISGTPVDQNITAPGTVRFNITDDAVAVELDEEYPLTIAPYDPAVIVMVRMTNITITDDIDSMCIRTSSPHTTVHYQERMMKQGRWESV